VSALPSRPQPAARGADDSADEVSERLAGLYTQMGAYDAAASAYRHCWPGRKRSGARGGRRFGDGQVLVLRASPTRPPKC
jgi:hypothetical protein